MKHAAFLLITCVVISALEGEQPTLYRRSPGSGKAHFGRSKNQPFLPTHLVDSARIYLLQNKSISQKNEAANLLNQLERTEHLSERGNDELRKRFINVQGCVEHALVQAQEKGDIIQVVGMIHASHPATPLCTKPEDLEPHLVDTSTIPSSRPAESRCQILRNYLENGNVLYVLYPDGGLENRSTEQQEIYVEELKKHPNLIDWVLATEKIDPEMIGATYFYQNNVGNWYVFSVKGRAGSEIQDKVEWGLWLGEVSQPAVSKRIGQIFKYLKNNNGPAQTTFFPKR